MANMIDVGMGPIGMSGFADSFFGQSDASPFQSAPSLGAMLKKLFSHAPQIAAVGNEFDAAKMPGQLATQLGAEALYDPGMAALRADTTSEFQHQLDLARQGIFPPGMLEAINQGSAERGSLTGMGGSAAGRQLFAADLGLNYLKRLQESLDNAANWTRSSPGLNELFQPNQDITPGFGASYDAARLNANNAYQQYLTQVKNQNTMNMIDRPLGIAQNVAGIVGAFYGMGNKGGGGGVPGQNTPATAYPAPVANPSSYGIQLRGNPSPRY